jgi:hypothetical protein
MMGSSALAVGDLSESFDHAFTESLHEKIEEVKNEEVIETRTRRVPPLAPHRPEALRETTHAYPAGQI